MGAKRNAGDWGLFALLTLLWASAYAFTRLAVNTGAPEAGLPPALIIPTRLSLGAIILITAMYLSGHRFPPFSETRQWLMMAAMGLVGTAAPFFAITTAQQTVDSSLAALYVAAAPLFVGAMAHFAFADDRMTSQKALGLAVGFAGVAVLFGPDAISAFGSASMTAQALCLLATAFYATSTIIARGAPPIPTTVFAAGFVTIAALLSLPMLAVVDWNGLSPAPMSIAGVIALAVGPTATASLMYMMLVRRTSATFLSLTGYAIPIVAVLIGLVAFGETPSWNMALAFALILGGVWLSQRPSQKALSAAEPAK